MWQRMRAPTSDPPVSKQLELTAPEDHLNEKQNLSSTSKYSNSLPARYESNREARPAQGCPGTLKPGRSLRHLAERDE